MARLEKHDEHCRNIANELDCIAYDQIVICEECGEQFDEEAADENDEGEKICPHCNEPNIDPERVTMGDWLDDALDIDVLCNIHGEYKAAKICVGWGGPNVYVDTWTREVRLYWGGDEGSWSFSGSAADELDECVGELFSCSR